MTIRSPFSWLISSGPSTTLHACDLRQKNLAARWRRHHQLPDCLGGAAIFRREPHDDGNAFSAIDDLGRLRTADAGLHCRTNLGHVQPIAGKRTAIERQFDLHGTGGNIHRRVGGTWHLGDHVPDLARLLLEHREIVSKQLYAKLGSHPRYRLVETHGHRRREVYLDAGIQRIKA